MLDGPLALLIGTDAGPVTTAWPSLAMLLWYERCQAFGLVAPKRRVAASGSALAVFAVAGATAALVVTG